MNSEWETVKLGDVFDVSNTRLGAHIEEPPVFAISKYAGVVLGSEYHDRRIASQNLDTYKVVDPQDWAYSTIHIDEGSIARSGHSFTGVVSPMYTILKWKALEHDARYFELLLRAPAMLAVYGDKAQGSVNRRRSLPWKTFASIEVDVPSSVEQRRIVDLIGALDNAIEAAKVSAAHLKKTQVAALAHILSEQCGSKQPLDSVFEHVIGGSWGSAPGVEDTNVISIGSSAYALGRINVDPGLGAPRSLSRKRTAVRELRTNDIVLERSGGSPTQPVGRVLLMATEATGVVPSDFMRLLRVDASIADPKFVFWTLWSLYSTGASEPFQKFTTGIRNLNIPDYLRTTSISIPDDSAEQARFVELAEASSGASESGEEEIDRLRTLRSELLTALLSGAHEIPASYDEMMSVS